MCVDEGDFSIFLFQRVDRLLERLCQEIPVACLPNSWCHQFLSIFQQKFGHVKTDYEACQVEISPENASFDQNIAENHSLLGFRKLEAIF